MADPCDHQRTRTCEDPLIKRASGNRQFKTSTREELREQIEDYTFNEARRVKGPIYDALIQELFEENCPITAFHLKNLSAKEDELIESTTIRDRVSDNKPVLLALFENAKMAEKSLSFKACGGFTTSFRMLYQILILLEPKKIVFDWLLSDVYAIIGKICDCYEARGNHGASEIIARIYDKYGDHLVEVGGNVSRTVEVYEKALFLARGESWPAVITNTNSEYTLHKSIGSKLGDFLINHAEQIYHSKVKLAGKLVVRAKAYIMEASKDENIILMYKASIAQAKYTMLNGELNEALVMFQEIHNELTTQKTYERCMLASELFYNMGVCLLDLKETKKASEHLERALALSRIYKLKPIEAQVQLNRGRIYAADGKTDIAVKAYKAALNLFKEMKDVESSKQVSCLLGKLKSDKIFPGLFGMIKSSADNCCAMYNLRRWKLQCQPFWTNLEEDINKHHIDPLYCMLEKDTRDPDDEECKS